MPNFLYINTDEQLAYFCQRATQQPFLYLDTEFVRTRTLRPKLGLIQAYNGEQIVLIDPLASINLQPFWSLLTITKITKVLHSCSEDLEVFKYAAGCQPEPLFDTQVAATLLNEGRSMGYAALCDKLLGIQLDKGATRTDWLARPLSSEQLAYAVKDVQYLKPLAQQLMERLKEQDCYEYVIDEGKLLVKKREQEKLASQVYMEIKNAWRLNSQQLAILKVLAEWRQLEAEKRDLALNFVLKEPTLIEIAKVQPQHIQQLRQIDTMSPQQSRRYGTNILAIVAQGLNIPEEQWPQPLLRIVDFKGYKESVDQIKTMIQQVAERQQIPMESMASKRQIHQLLSWHWKLDKQQKQQVPPPDLLQGWRYQLIGEQLEIWLDAHCHAQLLS